MNASAVAPPIPRIFCFNGTQRWFVKAGQGGQLTVTLVAYSTGDPQGHLYPETAIAKIFDPSGNQMTIVDSQGNSVLELTASYPAETPAGTEVSASGTVATSPGTVYRVEVGTPGPVPKQTGYFLKFLGAQEAGINSPSFPSFPGGNSYWLFNVASGEPLNVRIFSQGTPDPSPTTVETFQLVWIAPDGTASSEQIINVGPPNWIDQIVSPPDASPAPGIWTLSIRVSGTSPGPFAPTFYRLQKTSGADRGIYINWYSGGEGTAHLRILDGNGQPFTGTVQGKVTWLDGTVQSLGDITSGALDGDPASGRFTVEIAPPEGYAVFLADGQTPAASQTVDLTCGGDVTITFVVKDVTPPVIGTVTISPAVLGLANHQMVSIALGVTASDNVTLAPACRVVSVASNEPPNGSGDGNTSTDYTFSGVGLDLSLRAERAGTLTDRIYTVAVVCRDAAGIDSSPTTVAVVVPHDQGKK